MHMYARDRKVPWPDGVDSGGADRLMVMAGVALDRLEEGGQTIAPGPIRDAYNDVVGAPRQYWLSPSDRTHDDLVREYDNSRDDGTRLIAPFE